MKRYRVISMDFDSRAASLAMEIRDDWEERVKEQHRANQENIKRGLLYEYGSTAADVKLQNFIDLGSKPMSILAFHNRFLEQTRRAFVVGSYYPALTAACSLGERILNHLIRILREDFKSTPEYKEVYRKDSFDDWDEAIDTLESWRVLLPEVIQTYRELKTIRHRSIHFNPDVDTDDRTLALGAIGKLTTIISRQFGSFGNQPWFIPGIRGASYIKKEAEEWPFVKRVYIPNSHLVGPLHKLGPVNGRIDLVHVYDDNDYEEREISDDEFRSLLLNK
jgi:hypothetical protein